jgi:hypothetical protein
MANPPPLSRLDVMGPFESPEEWVPLPFERQLTVSEYERMTLGIAPRYMDEMWCVFFEDDMFYFHRWTGRCIFRMRLQKAGDGFVVSEVFVARYPVLNEGPQRNTEAELTEEANTLAWLVDVGWASPALSDTELDETMRTVRATDPKPSSNTPSRCVTTVPERADRACKSWPREVTGGFANAAIGAHYSPLVSSPPPGG